MYEYNNFFSSICKSIVENYTEKNLKKTGFIGGNPRPLLTIQGATEFNFWKQTEGGKMIAAALKILNSI